MSDGGSAGTLGAESDAAGDDEATTVLVVDDEEVVRESYALYLEPRGYEIRTAASVSDALALLDESVDIALVDRRMPERSGDELVDEIRTQNLNCRIAMVTAVDPDFDIVEMDCDDYLVKPVDKDDLIQTIERLSMLEEYDEKRQELSSLRVKRNVLEVEKHPDELDESQEFQDLEQRIAELEAEIENLEEEFDDQFYEE